MKSGFLEVPYTPSMPFAELQHNLETRAAQGLLRQRRVLGSAQGVRITVDGKPYLSFCSNDYLGLASHPQLISALQQGAQQYGVGAGASHLVSGHFKAHHDLEQALAEFVGKPAVLLFSTGYMANLGVVQALAGRNDRVFADKLNHASLNDAMLLSHAQVQRYRHNDLAHLAQLLGQANSGRKLIVTDAVFSMDGDIAPLPELLALCEQYDAWLLVDDAHGFGVLGEQGRGSLFHFKPPPAPLLQSGENVNPPLKKGREHKPPFEKGGQGGFKGGWGDLTNSPRIIYMATLGKAAGVAGAFIAAEQVVIATLLQNARSYIYTTASPPALASALLASLKLMQREEWRREQLQKLIAQLQDGLSGLPWALMPSTTPIQPLLVGDNDAALVLSAELRELGIWVPAIRPPTVPQGTARLRISLSAAHSERDVAQLIEALHELAR